MKIAGIRILQHFLFWLISFRVLLEMFSITSKPAKIDIIYTSIFMFTLMIPVYLNLYLSIPRLLSKQRIVLFTLSFISLVLIFSGFNQLIFSKLIDYILKDYYFISYFDFIDVIKYFAVFMALTSLLKLSKAWFFVSETRQKLAETERQKIENELMALKSQVNPHFMFNSLNNIYSLALKKSDQTPGAIIKLGDILRYVIYEAKDEKVLLGKEIKMLSDYIDLQKIRTKNARVRFHSEIKDETKLIAPLLFLPLIENGFKHGIKGDREGFLNISLVQKGSELVFITENNKGKVDKIEKEEYRGIGIENVKRRLEISYPDSHMFRTFDNENTFRVELKLQMGEDKK